MLEIFNIIVLTTHKLQQFVGSFYDRSMGYVSYYHVIPPTQGCSKAFRAEGV